MTSSVRLMNIAVLGLTAFLGGCASIEFASPTDGAVIARLPVEFHLIEKGKVDLRSVTLDGQDLREPGNTQPPTRATLAFMSPGSHRISASAQDGNWRTWISREVGFSVGQAPLWFQCPPPQQPQPISGQCCDAGGCDRVATRNFGPVFYGVPACQGVVVPLATGQRYWNEFDCIGSQGELIRGSAVAGGARMVAVRFNADVSGVPRHLRLPVGHQAGTNSANIWITADSGNAPGAVIAQLAGIPLRAQPQPSGATPPVESPENLFFGAGVTTPLQAGNRYWLIVGPGATNTVIVWNHTVLQDFSTPGQTTMLINSSSNVPGQLGGAWLPKSNLAEPRPAFHVGVR